MWRKLTDEEKQLFIHHWKNVLSFYPVLSVLFKCFSAFLIIICIVVIKEGIVNKNVAFLFAGLIFVLAIIKMLSIFSNKKKKSELILRDIQNDNAYFLECIVLGKKSKKNSTKVLVDIRINDNIERRWITFYWQKVFYTINNGDKVLIFKTSTDNYKDMYAYDQELKYIRMKLKGF